MANFTGGLSILIGLVLVSLSSLGLVALARLKGIVSNVLALAIVAYAVIVVLTQILSEMHWVNRPGFLIGLAIIALMVLPWSLKLIYAQAVYLFSNFSAQKEQLKRQCLLDPVLSLLALFILGSLVGGLYLILALPPNSTDGLFYHLSRVAHWFHNGTLRHFPTMLLHRTVFPINAEIGLLWLTVLWGGDRLGGIWQWLFTIFTMVGLYGVARQLKFPRPAGLFAAFVWYTFTIVVIQSTAVKNDIIVAFFFLAAYYFLLAGMGCVQNFRESGQIRRDSPPPQPVLKFRTDPPVCVA